MKSSLSVGLCENGLRLVLLRHSITVANTRTKTSKLQMTILLFLLLNTYELYVGLGDYFENHPRYEAQYPEHYHEPVNRGGQYDEREQSPQDRVSHINSLLVDFFCLSIVPCGSTSNNPIHSELSVPCR